MACNEDLEAQGKPYPRTCSDCGLGPCKKHAKGGLRPTADDLAKVILDMTYGELREVAAEMSKMIEPGVRPKVQTQEDFADMLHDWAEAR